MDKDIVISDIKKQVREILQNNEDLYIDKKFTLNDIFSEFYIDVSEKIEIINVGDDFGGVVDFIMNGIEWYTRGLIEDRWLYHVIPLSDVEDKVYNYLVSNDIYIIRLKHDNNYYIIQK